MKLVVQPEAGVAPVVAAVAQARKMIDVFIFRFDHRAIEKALGEAVQRGVTVRAMIAHTNRGGESRLRKLEQRLLAAGITVSRSAEDLVRYHSKFMIADAVLHVFGFNFTRLDIESRSFAIATRDARTVAEASKLFEADMNRTPYVPGRSHLVVSPESARTMLSAFIAGAKTELAIYDAKIQDPAIIKLLKERAAKGVKVRVLGSMKGRHPGIDEGKLAAGLRLHVRAIVRDGTQAFVGSQSLRTIELDQRREAGLIINNPAVARKILQIFEADWADGRLRGEKPKVKDAA